MGTWVKAFGFENIAPGITVAKKIQAELEIQFNIVLCKRCCSFSKG